jgi:hypothetical protein
MKAQKEYLLLINKKEPRSILKSIDNCCRGYIITNIDDKCGYCNKDFFVWWSIDAWRFYWKFKPLKL